jgi:MFS family permease
VGLIPEDEPGPDAIAGPVQDLRERYRQQMRASIGGWSGTVVTAVPTVVFVVVNSLAGLKPAVLAAVASAVLLSAYRLIRREPVQHALSGLLGVAVAALIAARSGQARDYFLLGIITSFGYAAAFGISILVRRPLVGLLWEFLDPSPTGERHWRDVPVLMRAYSWATAAGFVLFLSRAVVQQSLFSHHATGWLAFTRIAMGYPLYALALAFAFWICRRAQHTLRVQSPAPIDPS